MKTEWQQGDIQTGDMVMHYTRTGGDKPVIVLAHGFSDNGMCWLPVAQALCTDYDMVLPDARGHGKSSRLQPSEKINRADDLAGFIKAMKLDRPVVGGHSMGGVTAAMLGAHYPKLTRALILEDPAWIDRRKMRRSRRSEDDPWLKFLEQAPQQPIEEVMAKCRADSPTWPEVELRPWAESKQQLDLNVFTVQDHWARWRDVARRIKVPTLLIIADLQKGAIVTPETAQIAQELNPLIQFVQIPGAGHNIRRENFKDYMEAVGGFLKTID